MIIPNARSACAFALLIPLTILMCEPLHAACTNHQVKTMAQNGATISHIARKCHMSKDDVNDIVDDDTDEDLTSAVGLPPGTPLGECGCYGYVSPNFQQPAPQCRSGVAAVQMCNMMCPAGGYAWRGVCK